MPAQTRTRTIQVTGVERVFDLGRSRQECAHGHRWLERKSAQNHAWFVGLDANHAVGDKSECGEAKRTARHNRGAFDQRRERRAGAACRAASRDPSAHGDRWVDSSRRFARQQVHCERDEGGADRRARASRMYSRRYHGRPPDCGTTCGDPSVCTAISTGHSYVASTRDAVRTSAGVPCATTAPSRRRTRSSA